MHFFVQNEVNSVGLCVQINYYCTRFFGNNDVLSQNKVYQCCQKESNQTTTEKNLHEKKDVSKVSSYGAIHDRVPITQLAVGSTLMVKLQRTADT